MAMNKSFPHLDLKYYRAVIQQATVGLKCPTCQHEFTRSFGTSGEFIDSLIYCPYGNCKEVIHLRIEWLER